MISVIEWSIWALKMKMLHFGNVCDVSTSARTSFAPTNGETAVKNGGRVTGLVVTE